MLSDLNKTKNKKILVAEDDEVNFLLVEEILEKYRFQIIHAITGIEAIELCNRHEDIELVLMDIKMPEMSGLEATRKIKEFRPDLPIVAQTAYAMTTDKKNALEAGCTDYLAKPIRILELENIIKKYFQ